ncbi:MAG: FkbM family methyltransferase, partial [Thermodesulfobacteriota bacterium]
IIPCAVSSKAGESFIGERDLSSSLTEYENGNGHKIRVDTLDNLFFQKDIPVSYIKADLEGYDFEAIKGAESIIRKYSPKIAITTYHNAQHSKQISGFITGINPNYKIKTKGIYQETGSPVMLHAWCD